MEKIIESNKEQDTYDLGYELGQHAKPEPVCSQTFTFVQVYDDGRLTLYLFDVYRIGDIEEMDEIGYEDYVYGEGVSLIEWANLIEEILPEHFTEIKIEKNLEKGFDYRRISICEF